MLLASESVVGTIRIEPAAAGALDAEDATLAQLLASFARRESLHGADSTAAPSVQRVTTSRLRWRPAAEADVVLRANLAQLAADLAEEWDRVSGDAS